MSEITRTAKLSLWFFKWFGLIPLDMKTLTLSKTYTTVVVTIIIIFWCGTVLSFILTSDGQSKISGISNRLQFLANGITFTIALVSPITGVYLLKNIHLLMGRIEKRISDAGIKLNYSRMRFSASATVMGWLIFLIYMYASELVIVGFLNPNMPLWYWVFAATPTGINMTALLFSVLLLAYALYTYKVCSRNLKELLLANLGPKVKMIKNPGYQSEVEDTILKLLYTIVDIGEYCNYVQKYFGKLFLSSFTLMFVVTAIQIFYCYVAFDLGSSHKSFSNLAISFNLIFVNVAFILSVTSLCQFLKNESKNLNALFQRVKVSSNTGREVIEILEKFEVCSEPIEFTALEFFSIDFSLLTGMVSAITAYVVIYIQFYAMLPADQKNFGNSRSAGGSSSSC